MSANTGTVAVAVQPLVWLVTRRVYVPGWLMIGVGVVPPETIAPPVVCQK